MTTEQRRQLLSTLAKSSVGDIREYWKQSPQDFDYRTLREPQTGMVMAVARTEASGEPFNLGEVTVTRCALQLRSGHTGIGYVMGSDKTHALHVALLDALAQCKDGYEAIFRQVIAPLQQKIERSNRQQRRRAASTRVDFLTMVRGEDE